MLGHVTHHPDVHQPVGEAPAAVGLHELVAVTTGDDPPAGLSDPFRVECGNCKGIAAYPQSALVAAKPCF